MFAAAGNPGDAKKIQVSVATARKVFRVMRPLESLAVLLHNPSLNKSKPILIEIINKLKPILMSIYFGADHVVWAQQAGLLSNKELTDRAQKASMYGWLGGSLCTIVGEIYEIQAITSRRKGETDEQYEERQVQCHGDVTRRTIVLIHAAVQALLAAGLLQLRPWKPRTVGLIGVVASVMNCYMLYPTIERPLWGVKAPQCSSSATHSKKQDDQRHVKAS